MPPRAKKINIVPHFLGEFGLTLEGGLKPTTKDYAALLEKLKNDLIMNLFKQCCYVH